jgi:PAS domain S-box-containing protein
MSYQARLLSGHTTRWFCLFLILLLFAAYIFLERYDSYCEITEDEQSLLAQYSAAVALQLEQQLQATGAALDSIRRDYPLMRSQPGGTALLASRLKGLVNTVPAIRRITVVSAQGVVSGSSRSEEIGTDVSGTAWYRLIYSDDNTTMFHISGPFTSRFGEYCISAGQLIAGRDGRITGCVLAVINPDYIGALFRSMHHAPDMSISLIHADGRIVHRIPDLEKITGINLLQKPGSQFALFMQSRQRERVVTGFCRSTGDEQMIAFHRVVPKGGHDDETLVVSISRPISGIYAHWRKETVNRGILFAALNLASVIGLNGYNRRRKAHDRIAAEQEMERMQAAREIADERVKLKAAIGSMTDAVYISDEQGRLILCNDAFVTFHRFRHRGEFAGTLEAYEEAIEVFMADGSPAAMDMWAVPRALRGESGSGVEYSLRRRDTGKSWVGSYSFAPIRGAEGVITGAVMVCRDITEMKKMDAALRRSNEELEVLILQRTSELRDSEEKFRSLVEATSDMIWEVDAQWRFTYLSPRIHDLLGYAPEELLGRRPVDFMEEDEESHGIKQFYAIVSGRQPFHLVECRYRHRDGRFITAEVSGEPIISSERAFAGYRGITRDITAKKHIEEELHLRQQQLEELNASLEERVRSALGELRRKDHILVSQNRLAAMGEMVSNIAHQWRQPLNNIGLLVQNLEMDHAAGELDTSAMRAYVAKCMNIIGHMSQTIDDFRNFFKPDTERQEFTVCQAVNRAAAIIRANLESQHISLTVKDENGGSICGYAGEYSQALLNIINNAKDVLVERRIEGRRIEVQCGSLDERSVVTVRDNGGGISSEILTKIFDPYFTTKHQAQGTGIGLYMSKIIIEQHMGGRLTAYNVDGGAEFRIEV